MNQFINDRNSVVQEAIDGMLFRAEGKLARLDGYPHIKVVVRTNWDKRRVALVSGGGSGHEPSHAGFVGEGMLTAAVCGEVFASPSVDAVLAGILAVTGEAGCLLIVKNYTGDRLNFGLAAERARSLGRKVRMVVVGDDVALPDIPQPRGVAGTLFLHKIVGAMAAKGASLDEVADTAESIVSGISSMGMSLDTCSVPGFQKEDRIGQGKAELGLGIHGEPGIEQINYSTAKAAMELVLNRLLPHTTSGSLVAILNNLGGCTSLEMDILANALVQSSVGKKIIALIGPAPLMTSLDMRGFSVSLYSPSDVELNFLKTPVEMRAWPGCCLTGDVQIRDVPDGLRQIGFVPSKNEKLRLIVEKCCTTLIDSESALNALDAKSGDGDTGSTLAKAAKSILDNIDQLPMKDSSEFFQAISQILSESMGGSSGVLISIFFAAASEAAKEINEQDSLLTGLDRIKQVGGAKLGDRTLIDALEPALLVLNQGLIEASKSARDGADATSSITQAKAGRASYLSADSLLGHNDPGAEAVAKIFEILAVE